MDKRPEIYVQFLKQKGVEIMEAFGNKKVVDFSAIVIDYDKGQFLHNSPIQTALS